MTMVIPGEIYLGFNGRKIVVNRITSQGIVCCLVSDRSKTATIPFLDFSHKFTLDTAKT